MSTWRSVAHLRRLGSLGHSLRRPPFPPFPLQHYRSFTAGGIVPSPTDSNHPDAHTDFLALHDRLLAEYRRQCGPGQPEFVPVYSSHDQNEVFSNNEINMRRLEVYGFDYDYTLAGYTPELSHTIYNLLRDSLIKHFHYPLALNDIHYDPDFATRGLHYDVTTGWLMKMDAYNHIQLDTVHLGKERVPPEIVTERHQGLNVSPQYVENNTQQLIDLFSLPWACLLADVIQLFKDRNISFHPHHLYDDLHACTEYIHKGEGLTMSLLHSKILEDLPRYLDRSPKLTAYLEKLQRHGKKTFLLTNSGFKFVDKGLAYVTGRDDWRDLFDLTIVRSAKPTFYRSNQPFRMIIPPKSSSPGHTIREEHSPQSIDAASVAQATWGRVSGFQPGAVYQGGNLRDFSQWTGWNGSRSSVIYFGDSLYSDLVDPALQQGWRTGAIIGELGRELEIRQKFTYHRDLTFLESLERLMKRAQRIGLEDRPTRQAYRAALQSWREERKEMHHRLKHSFNPQFGSVFRTHHSASGFAAKIRSHADIYTSRLENVGQYPLDHVFYPDRTYLQHEQTIDFTSPFRL